MNLILLPGNSRKNNDWIEELSKVFKKEYNKVKILKYEHWQTEDTLINLNTEAKRLGNLANELRDYHIIAKSAGCILTMYASYKNLIRPEKCYFIGTPIDWANQNNFETDKWISDYKIPTLAVQKSEDNVTCFKSLNRYINDRRVESIEVVEIPGDGHHYADINQLRYLWTKYLRKQLL